MFFLSSQLLNLYIYIIRKVPKSNTKIIESEARCVPLTVTIFPFISRFKFVYTMQINKTDMIKKNANLVKLLELIYQQKCERVWFDLKHYYKCIIYWPAVQPHLYKCIVCPVRWHGCDLFW